MPIQELIKKKYKISEKIYNKKLTNEEIHTYLSYFDIMNMYPLFPRPIIFKVDTPNYNINEVNKILEKDPIFHHIEKFDKISEEYIKVLDIKTKAFLDAQKKFEKFNSKVRYFFSYEIVDYVVDTYNGEYVTNAWLKCYEILELFQLLNKNDKNIYYFGTCEQPGAFIYCINHYVKTKIKPDTFNFIAQSLKPEGNDKIFKAENELYGKYYKNYDYAENNGDITNIKNIKYYREKYFNIKFNIISADCGLDASEDFSKQESNIAPVVLGQFINAIGLLDVGGNYFFKLYCIYEKTTAQVVYLASLFFETVYLTRVLKTKITSNEIYCVCKNFKFSKKEMNEPLNIIYSRYEKYMLDNTLNIVDTPEEYVKFIIETNKVLLYSKLLSINFMYFRALNYNYVKNNPTIIEYVNKQADHYVKYFCDLYKVEPLKPEYKLVEKVFVNKWKK